MLMLGVEGAGCCDGAPKENGLGAGCAFTGAELNRLDDAACGALKENGFGVDCALPKMLLVVELPKGVGAVFCGVASGRKSLFLRFASSPVESGRWPFELRDASSLSECSGDDRLPKLLIGGGKEIEGAAGAAKLNVLLCGRLFPKSEAPPPNDIDCCCGVVELEMMGCRRGVFAFLMFRLAIWAAVARSILKSEVANATCSVGAGGRPLLVPVRLPERSGKYRFGVRVRVFAKSVPVATICLTTYQQARHRL